MAEYEKKVRHIFDKQYVLFCPTWKGHVSIFMGTF